MDTIVTALGGLLLKALSTFILVVLLHFYLKYIFFVPLDKVLAARRDATEGARAAAQASFDSASRKAAEYEAAIRAARGEIYKGQEETRGRLRQEQHAALDESRRKASETVKQARLKLAGEAAEARQTLVAENNRLASAIADSILRGNRN